MIEAIESQHAPHRGLAHPAQEEADPGGVVVFRAQLGRPRREGGEVLVIGSADAVERVQVRSQELPVQVERQEAQVRGPRGQEPPDAGLESSG